MSKRKNHAPAFKAKVALAALAGEKTITELSSEFSAYQRLGPGVFSGEIKTEEAKREKEMHELHAKIGRLTVERDFLAKARGKR